MLVILIATVATGLGAAGLALALPRLAGRRAPRWAAPAAGGLGMFAFTLWEQYSWFDRVSAALPGDAVIAETYDSRSWLQPWTLVAPRPTRFAAVLPRGPAEGPPGLMRADVLLLARFAGPVRVAQVVDCARGRRARLPAGGMPDDPAALDWTARRGDPLVRAACGPLDGEETEDAPDSAPG